MQGIKSYIAVLLMGTLMVSAQALWGTVLKNQELITGSPLQIISKLLVNPRIIAGAVLYILATCVYFFLLSSNRFFVVQITMTAVAIVFSCLLASFLFHEKIGIINAVGIILVFAGLVLTMKS